MRHSSCFTALIYARLKFWTLSVCVDAFTPWAKVSRQKHYFGSNCGILNRMSNATYALCFVKGYATWSSRLCCHYFCHHELLLPTFRFSHWNSNNVNNILFDGLINHTVTRIILSQLHQSLPITSIKSSFWLLPQSEILDRFLFNLVVMVMVIIIIIISSHPASGCMRPSHSQPKNLMVNWHQSRTRFYPSKTWHQSSRIEAI